MSKINPNVVTVRINGRGIYSFHYKTPIRGDYYINMSNDSELYDEWKNNESYPSQTLIKKVINKAKQGDHYSKEGKIIE